MANPNPIGLILPVKGVLYLFYDDLAERWGYDPIHRAVFKVLFVPKLADTKTAQAPDFLQDVRSCSAIHLEPKLRFPYGGPDESQFEEPAVSSAEKDSFSQFADLIKGNAEGDWRFASTHKAFGRFNSIQGPMEEECALVTPGINCGKPEGYNSPQAQQVLPEPNDGMQLLEIGTDDDAGMMWGDMGTLFLWIKKPDLADRNFETTWLILHCS